MDIGEAIAVGGFASKVEADCPFAEQSMGAANQQKEGTAKDDKEPEENDGGVLGRNLASGSPGKEGTVEGPYPPPTSYTEERWDTRRKGVKVKVPGTRTIAEGTYGFTVAAHHLIPGEASLAPSALMRYMTKGSSVQVIARGGKKTKTIKNHIGYNVNGAHNGVWLPGNYYIRSSTSPAEGKSWSDLGHDPWCLHYVAAVTKVTGGQFHDAHTQYSAAVEKLLNKIAAVLVQHECDRCKPAEINPPFCIKARLYALSEYLRSQLKAQPFAWKRPWFSSDRWRDNAFNRGRPSRKFLEAGAGASLVLPPGAPGVNG